MNNFTYYIPTEIYFGKGQISHLAELADYGKNVLLVYGGGSIKKNGIYDSAMNILKEAGLDVFELGGVHPNPRISSVREGVKICKENQVDMVLAVGGGSSIDCAKVIAAGALYDGDAWDLVKNRRKIQGALPIFAVLTMAATGSEMNIHAVITDPDKNEKWGTGAQCMMPTMSICDPEYSYTLPAEQTAAGVADIMSHTFENYFNGVKGAFLQSRFAESVLKTCIKYGPIALEHPDDYEARANIMWAATNAINGLLNNGAGVAWSVHPMGHEISAFYDVTHGVSLSILTPHWMRFALRDETVDKFVEYGVNVWGLDPSGDKMDIANKAIDCTYDFFVNKLHLPATLREVGVKDESHFDMMARKAARKCIGSYVQILEPDVISIYRAAM